MTGANWDLLCSLNLRNWSDRFSNWSFAEAAGLDARLAPWIIAKLRLPPRSITLFLHEVTHHALFDSPVGWALANLTKTARHTASRFKNASEVSRAEALELFEPVLRIQVVSNMLKPLNEGIALFAEHDVYDKNMEDELSAPLRTAWRLYASQEEKRVKPTKGELVVNDYLLDYRTSPAGFERKARLLSRPFAPVQDDVVQGGLPAYMFLKLAFINARMAKKGFYDLGADFFLSYVIWFFFFDHKFALLLAWPMSPSIETAEKYAQRLVGYFRERVAEFYNALDYASLCRRREEIGRVSRRQSVTQSINRELMRVAAYAITIKREQDAMLLNFSNGNSRLNHDAGVADDYDDGPGTIEFHVSPWQQYGCLTVHSGGRTLYAGPAYNDGAGVPANQLFDPAMSRDEWRVADESEREHLRVLLEDLPEIRFLAEDRDLLLEEADEIYTTLGLRGSPPAGRETAMRLMRDSGLVSILQSVPNLFDRYVELSTYASVFSEKRLLAEQFARDNIDLNQVLSDLDRCYQSSGFLFYVEYSDGSLFTLA